MWRVGAIHDHGRYPKIGGSDPGATRFAIAGEDDLLAINLLGVGKINLGALWTFVPIGGEDVASTGYWQIRDRAHTKRIPKERYTSIGAGRVYGPGPLYHQGQVH